MLLVDNLGDAITSGLKENLEEEGLVERASLIEGLTLCEGTQLAKPTRGMPTEESWGNKWLNLLLSSDLLPGIPIGQTQREATGQRNLMIQSIHPYRLVPWQKGRRRLESGLGGASQRYMTQGGL